MNLFKSLFDRRKKDEKAEPVTPSMPEPVEKIPQGLEETPPEPVEEEPIAPPAPEITADTLAKRIESCKAALINCGLSNADIDKYSSALTTMEQAICGLHPEVNVDDLMDYLNQVFSSALLLILSCGSPLQRDKAIMTINDSIKTLPSTLESQVKIATLQLAILIQTAQIISSQKTIADLEVEKKEYADAEEDLLKNTQAKNAGDLSEKEKVFFDEYERQIKLIDGQIKGTDRLIESYNADIGSLKNIIRIIGLNPNDKNVVESQKKLDELREKMPSIAEFMNMVEAATKNTDTIRAKAKAQIRELDVKLENTTYIPDQETEEALTKRFNEIKGKETDVPVQETPETAQPEEEQPQTLLQ